MSMGSEFKEFINQGNVMDLAIGVIIGAAFQKIVDSLVNDILMPIVGMFVGADFASLHAEVATGVFVKYGAFIQAIINFVIIAFVVFMIVKSLNKMRRKQAA